VRDRETAHRDREAPTGIRPFAELDAVRGFEQPMSDRVEQLVAAPKW
jgi:hypothetical protein